MSHPPPFILSINSNRKKEQPGLVSSAAESVHKQNTIFTLWELCSLLQSKEKSSVCCGLFLSSESLLFHLISAAGEEMKSVIHAIGINLRQSIFSRESLEYVGFRSPCKSMGRWMLMELCLFTSRKHKRKAHNAPVH